MSDELKTYHSNLQIDLNFIKQLKQKILQSRYQVAQIANTESSKLKR